MDEARPRAVLDTNVFVAAGFNRRSSSADIVRRVAGGEIEMVWSEATRAETALILRKIPRLRWEEAEPLFRDEWRHDPPPATGEFGWIEDPDDRKFAALAAASGATLVSADDHLLRHRGRPGIDILPPGDFLRRLGDG